MLGIRWGTYLVGVIVFSFGISMAIKVQHLGIHPWDVLNVGLYDLVGLTIGTWAIIISFLLIMVSWALDKSYIKIGTFLNAFLVGLFVDLFLWLDYLPVASYSWSDIFIIAGGIVVMGIGGGVYNAAGVGSGPRDGFMLSIADKSGLSIGKVRIITESAVLVIGLLLGGPVFIFTFVFTFIQSPIFQYVYVKSGRYIEHLDTKNKRRKIASSTIAK